MARVDDLVDEMTLDEQVSLLAGGEDVCVAADLKVSEIWGRCASPTAPMARVAAAL